MMYNPTSDKHFIILNLGNDASGGGTLRFQVRGPDGNNPPTVVVESAAEEPSGNPPAHGGFTTDAVPGFQAGGFSGGYHTINFESS
jgi:hypothetical protein